MSYKKCQYQTASKLVGAYVRIVRSTMNIKQYVMNIKTNTNEHTLTELYICSFGLLAMYMCAPSSSYGRVHHLWIADYRNNKNYMFLLLLGVWWPVSVVGLAEFSSTNPIT